MEVKNLLSQSIFQAKKLKEASAQVVKDNLLSELTTSLKRRIRQSQQDIPEFQDQILDGEQDTFEPQEQEMPVTEEQEILTDDQELPLQQQDTELDDIIQELDDETEQVPTEEDQDLMESQEDQDLMERIREILESEQEQFATDQIPAEQEVVEECGEGEYPQDKIPAEVVQSFKKKVRQLTRENLKYKKSLQLINEQLAQTKWLQLKGKYALNIFNKFNLTKAQKMKIIENFDRAKNEREIKLVYATLMQGLNSPSTKKSQKTPASKAGASRKINSTKTNIKENRDLTETQNSLDAVARVFKKRAGIF